MDSFQNLTPGRREYPVKTWLRALYGLLGVAAIAGMSLLAVKSAGTPDAGPMSLMALCFVAFGLYMLLLAFRSRLVLEGTRITVRYAFREHSADLAEIEGYRTVSTRNGTFQVFYLKDGRGKFSVQKMFATDDDFRAWLHKVPDLDAKDSDALLAEIEQDQELGATPEERLATLAQGKTWNIALCGIAGVAAAALNWGPAQYQGLAMAVLALAPVAALWMMLRTPLVYAVFKQKADPRADLAFGLLISAFGLFFRSTGYSFVTSSQLWVLVVPLAAAYFGIFFFKLRGSNQKTAATVALLLPAAFFAWGLTVLADTLGDTSKSSTYIVPVVGKHSSSGRSASYYLRLEPWGPIPYPDDLSVSSATYQETETGDAVCVGLHEGRLHAAWFQLVSCTDPANSFQPK